MELVFLNVQPDDNYFVWQVEAQIENFINLGYKYEYHCLLYKPLDRKTWNKNFKLLEEKYKDYPNIKFFYYESTVKLERDMKLIDYIPLLRPYCLEKHFLAFPELSQKALFYWDSDVIFTKYIDFDKYLNDDICYLSKTDYLNLEYLEGKINECPKEKIDELRASNPIERIAKQVGVNKDILRNNNSGVGGAQYLIKGIDARFWKDVYDSCVSIRSYFRAMNMIYFASENAGWQSWCSDMWAVLWNLWKRDYKTECPEELSFAWGTDPIEDTVTKSIYHNAHITKENMELDGKMEIMFFKGRYHFGRLSPHKEKEYLQNVCPKYASYCYSQHLLSINNPIF